MSSRIIPPSELIINADGSVYHLGLRPDQLAPLVITVGDPDRVESVAQHLSNREFTLRRREFVSTTGCYGGNRITVLSTGMGTDNVEIVMTELDALVNVDFQTREVKPTTQSLSIIRIGTSGALQEWVPLDGILASHTAIGLDSLMDFYALPQSDVEAATCASLKRQLGISLMPYMATADEALLQAIALDMVPGNTLTCPGFYAPQGRRLRLETRIPDATSAYRAFSWSGGVDNASKQHITNFEMETAGYYSMGRLLGHKMLSVNAIVAHRVSNTFSTKADDTIARAIQTVLDRLAKM